MTNYDVFNQPPEWSAGITMNYSWLTSLIASQRYKEQRKALRDRPIRTETFNIFLDNQSPTIFNALIKCLQLVMYVPIYTEKIICKSSGSDLSHIDTSDNSKYYNLKNYSDKVIITDARQLGQFPASVAYLISAVGNTSIDIYAITYEYEAGQTLLFPAMPAKLTSLKKVFESTKLSTYELTFDEFVEEAAPL